MPNFKLATTEEDGSPRIEAIHAKAKRRVQSINNENVYQAARITKKAREEYRDNSPSRPATSLSSFHRQK